MVPGINIPIIGCFPVMVFFILMCVIALMVPVSADKFSANTLLDRTTHTLSDNSSASVPDSSVHSGITIQGGQNAGNKAPGIIVVPVKKEQNPLKITPGQSSHKIGKIQILKGTLPRTRNRTGFSTSTADNQPAIEILDRNNTVLYAKKFSYQTLMTVPMKRPGQLSDQVPPVISTSSETTLVLPYIEGGRKIRVVDENDQAGDIVALADAQIQDKDITTLNDLSSPPPANPGSFNILILASGYSPSTIASFNTKADQLKQQILNTEPFHSFGSAVSVNIYPVPRISAAPPGVMGLTGSCAATAVV